MVCYEGGEKGLEYHKRELITSEVKMTILGKICRAFFGAMCTIFTTLKIYILAKAWDQNTDV